MNAGAVRRLRDVRMSDVAEVGGKAAGLGELFAAGVRVPEGVVINAGAAARGVSQLRSDVDSGAWDLGPGPFAVRSSGIAEDGAESSYAGMFETALEVSADGLAAATERVLASAHAARVSSYGPAANGGMAVIVQRMVSPVAAGVALSADPISGDRASTLVTAVRGVGERLVSGGAAGDEWVVVDGKATARRQPESAIGSNQAIAIAHEARRIAQAWGVPQDVEWAGRSGSSRPGR